MKKPTIYDQFDSYNACAYCGNEISEGYGCCSEVHHETLYKVTDDLHLNEEDFNKHFGLDSLAMLQKDFNSRVRGWKKEVDRHLGRVSTSWTLPGPILRGKELEQAQLMISKLTPVEAETLYTFFDGVKLWNSDPYSEGTLKYLRDVAEGHIDRNGDY